MDWSDLPVFHDIYWVHCHTVGLVDGHVHPYRVVAGVVLELGLWLGVLGVFHRGMQATLFKRVWQMPAPEVKWIPGQAVRIGGYPMVPQYTANGDIAGAARVPEAQAPAPAAPGMPQQDIILNRGGKKELLKTSKMKAQT